MLAMRCLPRRSKLPVFKLLLAGFYKLTGNEDAMRDTLIP